MHGSAEQSAVLTLAVALAVGAVTRGASRRTGFPHSIAMLLAGLATGLVLPELLDGHGLVALLAGMLEQGSRVSPALILYGFLPALVFESAFSTDTHELRNELGAILLLAVPALVVTIGLVAALARVLSQSSWQWPWGVALVFGALISETDPVAVVTLFKELGVSARLRILVEGESLLNDGTGIVAFSVLSAAFLETTAAPGVADVALAFLRVVAGGVLVGAALAAIAGWWIGRVFNDAPVETTLTLLLGYLAMVLGEGVLHVSGVVAVVVAGLLLSGPLRTRFSPEVLEFLERFWGMLAYIAETLIFWLVGMTAALHVPRPDAAGALLVLGLYVGIMLLRLLVVLAIGPLSGTLGVPLSRADCAVIAWGGMRGAVSLALALSLFESEALPETARAQVLLAATGVVLLSTLVNGLTMRPVLAAAGYAEPPLPIQRAQVGTLSSVLARLAEEVRELARSRSLRMVSWAPVEQAVERRVQELSAQAAAIERRFSERPDLSPTSGYWLQVLSIEREAYWRAFATGTVGPGALRLLLSEVDRERDRVARGVTRPSPERLPRPRSPGAWLARVLRRREVLGPLRQRLEYRDASEVYDVCLGVVVGCDAVLEHLDRTRGVAPAASQEIEEVFARYRRRAKEALEELRQNLPEVARAVETSLARRIALELERDHYLALARSGALEETTMRRAQEAVEARMVELRDHPVAIPPPEIREVLAGTPLLSRLDEASLERLASVAREVVVPAGELLFRQGDRGSCVYIVARGAVHVLRGRGGAEEVVNVLGGGDILGEIALLTDSPRTASIRAATPATLVALDREVLAPLLADAPAIERELWGALALHLLLNHLRELPAFAHLSLDEQTAWHGRGRRVALDDGAPIPLTPAEEHGFLFLGELAGDPPIVAPRLLARGALEGARARGEAALWLLPALLEEEPGEPVTGT